MRVALMVTCVVDLMRPQVATAARRVLEDAGCEVHVPAGQTCCGQPGWNAGYVDDARKVARNTIRVFQRAERVVCLAGSCATMMRVFYRELFEGHREEGAALELAGRVQEFSELLTELGCDTGPDKSRTVAYHHSCHMLRELGVRDHGPTLLRGAGAEVHELSDRCCGFGGTFSVKLPGVSLAMADDKLREARDTQADLVVGCDLSCLLHMQGRAEHEGEDIRFAHLAEYLDGTR
jgi:L-lactate dehydrogenase complex protein LldE